ncbi:Uncharacterized protein APZ42_001487 [Daphnia magna]|uniref:Uncharacterized protein n=1 Tax=Daphnia magna TaxID=35525 RepID=A0A164IY40_9CRUS|nr:Uncharacterized protein APZ42_001487 [Daphnia magna]
MNSINAKLFKEDHGLALLARFSSLLVLYTHFVPKVYFYVKIIVNSLRFCNCAFSSSGCTNVLWWPQNHSVTWFNPGFGFFESGIQLYFAEILEVPDLLH